MKIKTIYRLLLLSVILAGCGKEDSPQPSGLERNWLVVEDRPDDAIDHQRYVIFQETGIPVYYNDTIGSENRISPIGETFTYYEILQVFYSPGAPTPNPKFNNYVLAKKKEDLKQVLDYLQTEVLPAIPDEIYVPSILLVDTLRSAASGNVAHKGMNTIICGDATAFGEKDEAERKAWKGSVLRALVAGSLLGMESEWLEENFYALTYAVDPTNINYLYSTPKYMYAVWKALQYSDIEKPDMKLAMLGFIGTRTPPAAGTPESSWYVPEKFQDVNQYCEAILSMTEAEFTAIHGNETVVMAKYRVMKEKLQEYGFE